MMAITHAIIAAAHARGTHHYLVLDALDRLKTPHSAAWKDFCYAHIEPLLEGAKAPDNVFKDFKNHVLHPRDNYWGGAPVQASSWYGQCVDALRAQEWAKAAYAMGVLSHYVADPVHPFHTQQSEAENCIHRACEWSISRSYPALRAIGQAHFADTVVEVSPETNWLARLMCSGADTANAQYEKLIVHYDIHRGVVDPPSGLDPIAQKLVAQLIMLAAETCAVVFDKAFTDASVAPPPVSLVTKALGSIAKLPRAWMLKRMANATERRVVEAMYDELKTTGTVEIHLPDDDRVVRDLHKVEVLDVQVKPDIAKIFPFNPSPEAIARVEQSRIAVVRANGRPPEGRVIAMEPPRPAPARQDAPPVRYRADVARQITEEVAEETAAPVVALVPAAIISAPAAPRQKTMDDALAQGMSGALAAAIATITPFSMVSVDRSTIGGQGAAKAKQGADTDRAAKIHLTLDQDVVDAPSIGPKTAAQLRAVGVDTVDDFLKSHPIALAARLDVKHITADTIGDWQDQTRLVLTIPGLRGTHAQFLVGAGFRTADAVAAAETEPFCAAILAYVASSNGQRILRDGTPPDVERIKGWLENAKRAKAA